jgi:hypothetical protein
MCYREKVRKPPAPKTDLHMRVIAIEFSIVVWGERIKNSLKKKGTSEYSRK